MNSLAITYEHAKKAIACIAQILMFMGMIDAMILFLALAQIASGDNIGCWSPFWQSQARLLASLLR